MTEVRAARCLAYGAIPVVMDFAEPLGPGEVLIAVQAAAVNFPDVLMAKNNYQISMPVPFALGIPGGLDFIEAAAF